MSEPRNHPPSEPAHIPHLDNPAERQAQADRVILRENRQHPAGPNVAPSREGSFSGVAARTSKSKPKSKPTCRWS